VLPTWKDYVAVTLDDITSLERLAPSVTRRIRRLLDDLAAIVASDRRPELEIYRLRVADQQYDAA
jgi:ATP/maltotriose-dependent transcriptional regulator MalT